MTFLNKPSSFPTSNPNVDDGSGGDDALAHMHALENDEFSLRVSVGINNKENAILFMLSHVFNSGPST